jgi:hypothetical protein
VKDLPDTQTVPDNKKHSQKASMTPTVFEPTIPASERPQTHAIDREAAGIDILKFKSRLNFK